MADRIFVALELPAAHTEILQSCLSRWSRAYPKGINWVKPANLHVTALFVGDVESGVLPQLCEAVSELADRFAPFELALSGCELFPAIEPRLIWVKLSARDQRILALPKALARSLRNLGCEPDIKPMKLHVTLGRIKFLPHNFDERGILGAPIQAEHLPYSRLSVYKSILKPEGPTYHLIEQYDLK